MPQLDDNDCWLWQTILEKMIQRYLPDPAMSGRYLSMLRVLGAQARRANIPPENGEQ